MIIYEVNSEVAESHFESYLEWLNSHILEMLKLNGFVKADLFEALEEYDDEGKIMLMVHYYITNENALNAYFENDAPKMQKKIPESFVEHVSIWRRVLNSIDTIGGESNKNG